MLRRTALNFSTTARIKGIMSPVEYFLLKARTVKLNQYVHTFRHAQLVFKFIACSVLEKNQFEAFAFFFENTFIAGFRNNFQNHRQVSEQFLKAQAAIRKPEHSL
jgi:hypothetical protein